MPDCIGWALPPVLVEPLAFLLQVVGRLKAHFECGGPQCQQDPKPSSLTNGYTCKYDAWNRLVEVKDGATVVGKYEYDGLGRRMKKHLGGVFCSGSE